MPFRNIFLAAAALMLVSGTAIAAPIVNDANFNQTVTAGPSFYGMAAWVVPGNNSFVGNVGFDVNNQWNNGTPGNGQAKVGFIANNGFISQAISGFTVGGSYVITVLANGRTGVGTAQLQISTGNAGTVLFTGNEAPVAAVNSQAAAFRTVTTSAFVATAGTVNIVLTNLGASDSSVLLSGFAIRDVTAVPEPVSMVLVGAGLLGLAVVRRRG